MSKMILGYYTGWSTYSPFNVYDIVPTNLTHLLYAFFGLNSNGTLALLDAWADIQKPHTAHGDTSPLKANYLGGNLHQLFRLKKNNRGLKTGISIGGYNNSTNFATVVNSSTKRTAMANSIKTAVANYGLDFIDIDWEYPTLANTANFKLLLQKIKSVNPTIKIMISIGINTLLDMTQIHPVVDYIQLMALDFVGATWGSQTDAHQSLDIATTSIQQLLAAGVPSSKLLLECPIYARPSGQPSVLGDSITYNSLALSDMEQAYRFVNTVRASTETRDSNNVLFTYDSPETITQKCDFINAQNLGGISFWELSNDRPLTDSLVSTANGCLLKETSQNNLGYPTSIYLNIKNPALA